MDGYVSSLCCRGAVFVMGKGFQLEKKNFGKEGEVFLKRGMDLFFF